MLFKFMTTVSIYFLYLLISTSSGINCVTSLFLVLFILKTSNDLFISSVLIFSFFTSYLLILIWVQLKFTSIFSCNSFPFDILIFVYIFNSLFCYLINLK